MEILKWFTLVLIQFIGLYLGFHGIVRLRDYYDLYKTNANEKIYLESRRNLKLKEWGEFYFIVTIISAISLGMSIIPILFY